MALPSDRRTGNACAQEQYLYNHLVSLAQTEMPEAAIRKLRLLFVEGMGYPDPAVIGALDKVVMDPESARDFNYFLNRCCHIFINRWQTWSCEGQLVAELVHLFSAPPTRLGLESHRGRSLRRLRELVQGFVGSEQYQALFHLVNLQEADRNPSAVLHLPLGKTIRRYPYLYQHCLVSEGSPPEHLVVIQQLQSQVQHKFEVDLSKYITYRTRQGQILPPGIDLRPVTNPTLLPDSELGLALEQFAGRVDGVHTHRDLAEVFLIHNHQIPFSKFKENIYQYLTEAVDPSYGRRNFNRSLAIHLKNSSPQSDQQLLDQHLMARTCSGLFNFLVVESQRQPNHFIFTDLVSNLGPTNTTGLLLKVVLVCRRVKPYLEKRMSILFNHYQTYTNSAVEWLVKCLQNMNLALTTNFGALNLSHLQWFH